MRFTITTINSYHETRTGKHYFLVDGVLKGNPVSNLRFEIPSVHKEAQAMCEAWLEAEERTPIKDVEAVEDRIRRERKRAFATTIDRLSPIQYDSLKPDQKARLKVWRQAWLDAPATGNLPSKLDIEDII